VVVRFYGQEPVIRWSDLDFGSNAKDGHGVDWPIRYKDIAPWYDHVESFIGVSGIKMASRIYPMENFYRHLK
jgi:choline dehydrogenase-like flavoprotein